MTSILRPQAAHDLREAVRYYEDQSRGRGGQFLHAFRAARKRLERWPRLGRTVADLGIRRLTMKEFPYSLFYVIDEDNLAILRVIHDAQSSARWPTTS